MNEAKTGSKPTLQNRKGWVVAIVAVTVAAVAVVAINQPRHSQITKPADQYSALIEKAPQNAQWYHKRAELENAAERYDQAIADERKALSLKPSPNDMASMFGEMAVAYDSLGDHKNALLFANKAAAPLKDAKDKGERARQLCRLGLLMYHAGSSQGAEDRLKAAMLADANYENYTDSLLDLAIVHAASGRLDVAQREAAQAVTEQSKPAPSHRLKGDMYRVAGKFKNAIDEYTLSIDHDSAYALTYRQRAVAYIRDDQLQPALRDLQKSVQLLPTSSTSWSYLALVQAKLGVGEHNAEDRRKLLEEAQKSMDQAFAQSSQPAVVYANRAGFYIELQEWEKAQKDAIKAGAMDPCLADAYHYLSIIANHMGGKDAAAGYQIQAQAAGYPGATPAAG
jgi:tetratricopeptide (TPR) repeat protein